LWLKAVKRDGYVVLNADNNTAQGFQKPSSCKVAYFSMDENNPVIVEHCKKGGIAAIYENGYITIKKGDWKFRVHKVVNVPLTFGGTRYLYDLQCVSSYFGSVCIWIYH
jgi:cyanophycin synthetase